MTRPTYAAPKKVHSVKGLCFITQCASVTPFPDGLVSSYPTIVPSLTIMLSVYCISNNNGDFEYVANRGGLLNKYVIGEKQNTCFRHIHKIFYIPVFVCQ